MRVIDLFEDGQVLSYEMFPPKAGSPLGTAEEILAGYKDLGPAYVSVTCGAAGSGNRAATISIVQMARERFGLEGVCHLPCIGLSTQEVRNRLDEIEQAGIQNVLALRGDMPDDLEGEGDFAHASDLISFIKEAKPDLHVLGACYPEGHSESESIEADIENLKRKVDAGADQLISQLFFDNDFFYSFLDRCEKAGIDVPIEAGIMPPLAKDRIERTAIMCGASIPPGLAALLDKHSDDPRGAREAGIEYALRQIEDLLHQGVDGIHVYPLNDLRVARIIHEQALGFMG